MHTPFAHSPAPTPLSAGVDLARPATDERPTRELPDDGAERDRHFVAMLRAFRATGGLLRGDEAAELIAFHERAGASGSNEAESRSIARLARQIAAREVLSFEWRGERWLPLFQFDLATMALRDDVRQIASELAPTRDGWAVASWFAEPNPWLDRRAPVDALRDDVPAVLHAARAERFDARS